MNDKSSVASGGARSLPVVKLGGKRYYVDERLREIRNVENPHDAEPVSRALIEYWRERGLLKQVCLKCGKECRSGAFGLCGDCAEENQS